MPLARVSGDHERFIIWKEAGAALVLRRCFVGCTLSRPAGAVQAQDVRPGVRDGAIGKDQPA